MRSLSSIRCDTGQDIFMEKRKILTSLTRVFGSGDARCGDIENVLIRVYSMKEEGYVTMLMSPYGTNDRVGEEKSRERITLKYQETIQN